MKKTNSARHECRKCWGFTPLAIALLFITIVFPSIAQDQVMADDDAEHPDPHFDWKQIAALPVLAGTSEQPGVAGAFSGVAGDVLIIAGGGNFPDAPPWEGGEKKWRDEIYVLGKSGQEYVWEIKGEFALSTPAGNGLSVSSPRGLLCVGGENATGPVSDIVLLAWDAPAQRVMESRLGTLPEGFEVTGGSIIGDRLYVTGVQNGANALISIGMAALYEGEHSALSWETLEGCPGPARRMAAYASQSDGQDPCLFLFGGRNSGRGGVTVLFDGYFYNTRQRSWKKIEHCPPVMAAAALPFGTNNILIFGGDDGRLLLERDSLQRVIDDAEDARTAETAKARLRSSFVGHPGFRKDIVAFNTITKTFQTAGVMPNSAPVVTNAVMWDGKVLLPGGETRPGIRTSGVFASVITREIAAFQWLDYAVLAAYFLSMLVIGGYFSRRQQSTDDYFIGGGRIPWWAAGLSVFGTALSAITFMAIPAKTFATDWSYFFYNMSVLLTTPLIVVLFIPFYRRLKITTAYEYLEQRFNVVVRLFASLSFILFQLGRIAIILYLPAIALSMVTGVDIFLCILVVGVLSTAYTLMGGIEAVIWTDVAQVIILMGGAIFSLVFISVELGDDFGTLATAAFQEQKFTLADLHFALNQPTIWVVLVGGFFVNLVTYSTDQSLVQRYLTTRDEKSAARTAWTNAVLVVPATLIFFGVGTALYLYYSKFPERLDPFTGNNDAIFPWFIAKELPDGISGLLIAGLFAAAMSSLSSSMNSISTAYTTDFYRRFKRVDAADNRAGLRIARVATLLSGVMGIAFALWMATSDIISLWDKFFEILGLFTGGLGGVFLLGILFRKAHGRGAVAGLIVSSVVQYLVPQFFDIHPFLYVATGVFACVAVGYVASLIIPVGSNAEGQKLTFHNI